MINCGCCGVLFTPVSLNRKGGRVTKYCSVQCNALAYHRRKNNIQPMLARKCVCCDTIFMPDKFHPHQQSCSKKCADKIAYIENKPKRILYTMAWRKANPDLVRQYHRQHYKNHIGQMRLVKRLRSTGKIDPVQWEKICADNKFLCVQCFEPFDIKDLTVDHIMPVSLGGTNDISNLQPLCMPCNRLKGNRWIGTIPRGIYLNMVSK